MKMLKYVRRRRYSKMSEHKSMKEIHDIQEKIYDETKIMSQKELLKYFNDATVELAQKHGLKLNKEREKVLIK